MIFSGISILYGILGDFCIGAMTRAHEPAVHEIDGSGGSIQVIIPLPVIRPFVERTGIVIALFDVVKFRLSSVSLHSPSDSHFFGLHASDMPSQSGLKSRVSTIK